MVATLAQKPVTDQLKVLAIEFLDALRKRSYDYIWHHLITEEATRLLSVALFPIHIYKEGKIDNLFDPSHLNHSLTSLTEGLALAFQMDAEGIRSGFFDGISSSVERIGWHEFSTSDDKSLAFTDDQKAILLAETPNVLLIMPFVINPKGEYKVDLEALSVFSMYVAASTLYKIGLRALELNQRSQALTLFELTAGLTKPYRRLRELLIENPVSQQMLTPTRKDELQAEEKYTWLARDQVLKLLSSLEEMPLQIDMHGFLAATFSGYDRIPKADLAVTDIEALHGLNDKALRKAIASVLIGVDPVVAQREADKPHSPAEISDMEIPVIIDDQLYYLCMPFKSGVEITGKAVPVEVAYQIIRPFMYFPANCVVVFVTAKPCSQYLLNYIKVARATQGWAIEVIQHQELAKLFKINGLLSGYGG
jgi:hypothetical protein